MSTCQVLWVLGLYFSSTPKDANKTPYLSNFVIIANISPSGSLIYARLCEGSVDRSSWSNHSVEIGSDFGVMYIWNDEVARQSSLRKTNVCAPFMGMRYADTRRLTYTSYPTVSQMPSTISIIGTQENDMAYQLTTHHQTDDACWRVASTSLHVQHGQVVQRETNKTRSMGGQMTEFFHHLRRWSELEKWANPRGLIRTVSIKPKPIWRLIWCYPTPEPHMYAQISAEDLEPFCGQFFDESGVWRFLNEMTEITPKTVFTHIILSATFAEFYPEGRKSHRGITQWRRVK